MTAQAGRDDVAQSPSSRHRRSDRVDSVVIAFASILIIGAGVAAWAAIVAVESADIEPLKATVEVVAAESTVVTDAFLLEAESAGTIVARSLDRPSDGQPALISDETRRVMQLLVHENEAIDGIYIGHADGGFTYVTRSLAAEPGGLRLKMITNADGPERSVVEHQLGANLEVISSIDLPDDDYDPRSRPWYRGAASASSGWTEPYSFASSGEQGITFFRRHESFVESGMVLGVDMRLTDVTAFLSARQPGENGVAAIVSPGGAVVAGANVLDPLLLNAAIADARVGPIEALVSEVTDGNDRQVSSYSAVGGGEAWTLVVTALESDFSDRFSGQIRRIRSAIPLIALAFIGLVAMLASGALTRVRHLRQKATVDVETGLATRAETHARLEGYLEAQTPVLIVAAAIGHWDWGADFEADSSGLSELSACLKDFASPNGLAGRTGGSEFIVIRPLSEVDTPDDYVVDLLRELHGVFDPGGGDRPRPGLLALGWLSTADEPVGRRLDLVLRSVDLALLSAQSGPRDVVEYDDDLQLPIVVDERLRREFADAMEAGAFVTHFQPEIDLQSGAVVGAEALLRRKRPGGGVDPAAAFIADLERLGLLSELTHTVLDHVMDFASRWRGAQAFTIRINLAATELNDDTVMARLGRLSHVSDQQWCIELTERTIEQLDERAVERLHDLVHTGFEIALDDFGTGYSSMAELKRLPITTLKIDRTFVEPLRPSAAEPVSIASVIQNVASRLGLEIVAEGIETDSQRQALVDLGCERGQGWLMAPALAPNEFVTWAQERVRSPDPILPTAARSIRPRSTG